MFDSVQNGKDCAHRISGGHSQFCHVCPTLVTCLPPHLSHGDVEGGLSLAEAGGDVDAVDVAVEPLAEDHAVEGAVKLDPHSEQVLDQSEVSIVAS